MERSFDQVGLHALAERSLPPLPLQSGLPFDRGHGGSQLLKLCDGPVRLIAWSIGNCQFISSQTAIWQSTPLVFPIGSNSSASDLVASDFKPGRKDRFRDAHSRTVVGFVDISECSAARDLYAEHGFALGHGVPAAGSYLFEFSGALDCGFAGHQSFGDHDAGLCGQQTGDELSECVAQ